MGCSQFGAERLLKKLEKPSKPANSFILYCTEQGWDGRRMFEGMASEWRENLAFGGQEHLALDGRK